MSIDVEVSDLSHSPWRSPFEVYYPRLTAFELTPPPYDSQSIEHVDVMTTWRELTIRQAEEVFFWQQAFKDALKTIIEEWLVVQLLDLNFSLEGGEGK
jgi:hypothetical protein